VPEEQSPSTPLIDPAQVNLADIPTPVAVADVPETKRKPTADQLGPKEFCWGTGRRKSSVARVRIRPGKGKIEINKKELNNYFPKIENQRNVLAPLKATERTSSYDVYINLVGGGTTGQAGAAMLGLARALIIAEPDTFSALRDGGFLTRDSRMVERKKYGQKKARKRFQFSKR
jgi:small subunit ribosomal protein S9